MSFGLDSEDDMASVVLEESVDSSTVDGHQQGVSGDSDQPIMSKDMSIEVNEETDAKQTSKDDASTRTEAEHEIQVTEASESRQPGLAAEVSRVEQPPVVALDNEKKNVAISGSVSLSGSEDAIEETANIGAGEGTTEASAKSELAEVQPIASSSIAANITTEERQTDCVSNEIVEPPEKDVPGSMLAGGGVFRRFLQFQSSRLEDGNSSLQKLSKPLALKSSKSEGSTQSLQEMTKALAQKSSKSSSSTDGMFTGFRKLSKQGDASTQVKQGANPMNENGNGHVKELSSDTGSGILGLFRTKLQESLDGAQQATIRKGSDGETTKDTLQSDFDGTTNSKEIGTDDASPGMFGRLRAKVQESLEPRPDFGTKNVPSDSSGSDQEDRIDTTSQENGNEIGILGRLRAKVNESLETTGASVNENNSDSPETDQPDKGVSSRGKVVFDLIHRARDEWNKRGIIQFPTTGPYREKNVRIGKQIAEGGFSVVFEATDVDDDKKQYALKRIRVMDDETWESCEKESIICNVLRDYEGYILPMLGLIIEDKQRACYMLLPYMPNSLRAEVNSRLFSEERKLQNGAKPWKAKLVLEMFYHLLHGVEAMHDIGYSHRDLKLDNILFHGFDEDSIKRPVLSDFGSAGPISRPCGTRRDIFEIAEEASQYTTMSYRPPELFPGAIMVGHEPLDYCLVDCWSLGCTLFAILYGASPFECTFARDTGELRIGECNQLSVLADLPRPNPKSPPGSWYSNQIWALLEFILEKDRAKRPSLPMIQSRVSTLLTEEAVLEEKPSITEVSTLEDFQ
eukprot:scaffold818_cov136-Cylindrotheca_fusiformis.AAC.45